MNQTITPYDLRPPAPGDTPPCGAPRPDDVLRCQRPVDHPADVHAAVTISEIDAPPDVVMWAVLRPAPVSVVGVEYHNGQRFPVAGREEVAPRPAVTMVHDGGPITHLAMLALALGHRPDSTAYQVMAFLPDAPEADRNRLRLGWPREVRAWEIWYQASTPPTRETIIRALAAESMFCCAECVIRMPCAFDCDCHRVAGLYRHTD